MFWVVRAFFCMPGAAVRMCKGNSAASREYLQVSLDLFSSSGFVMPMDCELVIVSSLESNVATATVSRRERQYRSLAKARLFSGLQ